MEKIANDSIVEILSHMNGKDLLSACAVDKKFYEICQKNWHVFLKSTFKQESLDFLPLQSPHSLHLSDKELFKLLYQLNQIRTKLLSMNRVMIKTKETLLHVMDANTTLWELYNIMTLSIVGGSWPAGISILPYLQTFRLIYGNLKSIPNEIGNMNGLGILDFSNNQLTSLPPSIIYLDSLISLRLYKNEFTEVPPEIFKLKRLKVLNLQLNHITVLPPELGNIDHVSI